MADDTVPAAEPAATTPPPRPKRVAKRKKRAPTKRSAPAPLRTAPKATSSGAPLIAVYVILGLLVVFTSFYAGYLMGKGSDGGSGTDGPKGDGTVTIVEYSDFQCPFCSRAAPTVEQLKQNYGDRIEVLYKHFPLESIHPDALNAAIAAECVREAEDDDAFWTYHDKLFASQNDLSSAALKRYASEMGVDIGDCLDKQETIAKVRADIAEAEGRGVQGTPSFWIGDELVVGALPYAQLAAKVDEKLSGKPAAPAPAPTQPTAPQPPAKVDVATGANVMGEADAPVTIVEFSDFQCPFCARFYSQTEGQIVDQYVKTGKVRFSYRHFPLSFHQTAQKAAEASECAADQGKFWEMHDILFQRGQGDGTGLAVADLKAYAKELKLDTAKFDTCLDGGAKAAVVQKDFSDGQAAGVSGTPAFFVNGRLISGAQPFSVFQAAIEAELAK